MATKLKVINGFWTINQKPLKNCSIAKKNFFAQFIKMKLVKKAIPGNSTFKINPAETKAKYNHIFKHVKNKKVELNPNINNLIFEPKN